MIRWIGCLIILMTVLGAGAVERSPRNTAGSPVSGLLIDHTLTPQGRRFYKAFSSEWRLLTPRDAFNITIQELPDPARSSQIKILWNHKVIYSTFLGPARNELIRKSKNAASAVNEQLKYIQIIYSAQSNPDLAEDEL